LALEQDVAQSRVIPTWAGDDAELVDQRSPVVEAGPDDVCGVTNDLHFP